MDFCRKQNFSKKKINFEKHELSTHSSSTPPHAQHHIPPLAHLKSIFNVFEVFDVSDVLKCLINLDALDM